jgi:hypothetical protein
MEQTANSPAGTTIRSTETEGAATGGRTFLTNTWLFRGQWAAFFRLHDPARAGRRDGLTSELRRL